MTHTSNHLVGYLVGFLIVAAPLAMVAWHELSELLMGRVTLVRLIVSLGALVALGALATALARFLEGDSR